MNNFVQRFDDKFLINLALQRNDGETKKCSFYQIRCRMYLIAYGSQHTARHAFAQRAEDKEVHPKVLQKSYRHESVLMTMKYQSNFSFKKADSAIDAVLDF